MQKVILFAITMLLVGCTKTHQYTSLDIELMPCERGHNEPKFFRAIEFNADGTYKYPEQIETIKQLLRRDSDSGYVSDIVVFNHGWNKSPESAENDYQKFICRLHSELGEQARVRKQDGQLMVVGVFWPSTITNRPSDPYLLKPASYFKIRNRADFIAGNEAGASLANFYKTVGDTLSERMVRQSTQIHLIGHSFGARMTVRALESLQEKEWLESNELIKFLTSATEFNVVLLNAAMPKDRFDWIGAAVEKARELQIKTGQRIASRFTESTNSFLFNLHSNHDSANKFLFPLASVFSSDTVGCAVGACGVPSYKTLCISSAGEPVGLRRVQKELALNSREATALLTWNASMDNVIYSHSDIYKGRVARLVGRLLYDVSLRTKIKEGLIPLVDDC